jgi:hypothetical protein
LRLRQNIPPGGRYFPQESDRAVERDKLDMVLSIGCRVKSPEGVRFRPLGPMGFGESGWHNEFPDFS